MPDPLTPASRSQAGSTAPAPGAVSLEDTISLDKVAITGQGLALRERTIDDRREDARRGLAYLIVGCFAVTILGSFAIFIWRGSNSVDDILKLIQAIIAPVVAIVGAVTGFYFSSNFTTQSKDKTPPP